MTTSTTATTLLQLQLQLQPQLQRYDFNNINNIQLLHNNYVRRQLQLHYTRLQLQLQRYNYHNSGFAVPAMHHNNSPLL